MYPKKNTRYCKIYEIRDSDTRKLLTESDNRQLLIYAKTEEALNAETIAFLDSNEDKYLGDLFIKFMRKEDFKQVEHFDKNLRNKFAEAFKKSLSLDNFVNFVIRDLEIDKNLALKLVNEFRKSKGDIFTVHDFETETLLKIIENSSDIRDFVFSNFESQWLENNISRQNEAENNLKNIENDINDAMNLKEQLENEIAQLTAEKSEALSNISSKAQSFRSDLEACMQYLELFREHNEINAQDVIQNKDFTAEQDSVIAEPSDCAVFHESEDAVIALTDNLDSYGLFESNLMPELAEFLIAACALRQPVLITGPFGFEIANAVSASLFGHVVPSIDVVDIANDDLVRLINEEPSEIVVLRGVFVSGKIDVLISCLDQLDKQVILLHPYPDDLLLSNHGYYLYLVPLITDVFICEHFLSKVERPLEYSRYFFADTQISDDEDSDKDIGEPLLNNTYVNTLSLSPFEVCRWKAIFARMSVLSPIVNHDPYLLFMSYPLARCLRQLDNFMDLNSQFPFSKSVLKKFFGKLAKVKTEDDA